MGEAADEALRHFREQFGFNTPWHQVAAREAPDVLEAYRRFRQSVYERGVLDPKVQELIIIGIDAFQNWPGINVHIQNALKAGATKDELVQTMVLAGLAGGVHSMAFGLLALDEALSAQTSEPDRPAPGGRSR